MPRPRPRPRPRSLALAVALALVALALVLAQPSAALVRPTRLALDGVTAREPALRGLLDEALRADIARRETLALAEAGTRGQSVPIYAHLARLERTRVPAGTTLRCEVSLVVLGERDRAVRFVVTGAAGATFATPSASLERAVVRTAVRGAVTRLAAALAD